MRKRVLAIAAVTATLLSAGIGWARDLGEILVEKGLITPEELRQAREEDKQKAAAEESRRDMLAAKLPKYKEGTGFVFVSPDNRWELDMGGRLQVRHTFSDVDDAFVNSAKRSKDSQTFDVPRARLWWKGRAFFPGLKYEVQIDVASTGSGDVLRDGILEYELLDDNWLSIKGGQMKTPFCRQEITSSGRQEFVDRSVACQALRFERDKGVQLFGTPMNSLVEYYVGAYNGTGRNNSLNPDTHLLYIGRLATNPLGPVPYSEADLENTSTPRFAVGTSFGYKKYRADEFTTAATTTADPNNPGGKIITAGGGATTRVPPVLGTIQPFYNSLANLNDVSAEVRNFETDFTLRWLGLSVTGEYFRAFISNDERNIAVETAKPFSLPSHHFDAWGYYAQVGYFVIPSKLQLAFRYSKLTPNDKATVTRSDGSAETPRQTEILGALSYYFAAHNLKLQTDFGPITSDGVKNAAGKIDDRQDWRVRTQAQLIF
ncbi:MAG: hypothetical protein HY271_07880 [Deltaproteobacteria bacterium]|nr:hypothetical protein [Deltaproteobacteria bacterium]